MRWWVASGDGGYGVRSTRRLSSPGTVRAGWYGDRRRWGVCQRLRCSTLVVLYEASPFDHLTLSCGLSSAVAARESRSVTRLALKIAQERKCSSGWKRGREWGELERKLRSCVRYRYLRRAEKAVGVDGSAGGGITQNDSRASNQYGGGWEVRRCGGAEVRGGVAPRSNRFRQIVPHHARGTDRGDQSASL